jgi:hypothetical protein
LIRKRPRGGGAPEARPTEKESTVDTSRIHLQEMAEETVEAQHAGLERLDAPHGCIDGWVYLGFEGEDGEHTEEIERVPCRRCHR